MLYGLYRAGRSLAAVGIVALLATPVGAVTETYLFRDSLAPSEGTGNVLVPVSNDTGTIVTDGPDFRPGGFVTTTISASACASAPTVRAWSFPERGGLRHPNSSPAVVGGSYTISMLMRFDPMDDAYARLIDFSNSTQDTGIYKLDDGVSFYPVGTFASGSFVSGQDVFVTITREAGSKLVSLFINGTPAGTYTDDGDLYLPSASALYLLMDNTTGSAAITETDSGIISYLQVRDGPITAEEVVASLGTICTTVTCGDAAPSATIPSIRCRLDDLRGTVGGATALGKFQSIVGKRLDKTKVAIDGATTLCAQGKSKPSKKKLKRAAKLLASVGNKLNSRSAQKTITDATLRTSLVQSAGTLATDLKTLGAQPQCPTS